MSVSIPFVGSGVPRLLIFEFCFKVMLAVSIPFVGSGVPRLPPFLPPVTTGFEGCVSAGVEKKTKPARKILPQSGSNPHKH